MSSGATHWAGSDVVQRRRTRRRRWRAPTSPARRRGRAPRSASWSLSRSWLWPSRPGSTGGRSTGAGSGASCRNSCRKRCRRRATRSSRCCSISIDTLRADALGAYGNARARTPWIDRLASAGVRFDAAYAHNVVTLPSHVNMLTGRHPFEHGVRDNNGFRVPKDTPTLATLLQPGGHRSGGFVSAFVLDERFGLASGFERWDARVAGGEWSRGVRDAGASRRRHGGRGRALAGLGRRAELRVRPPLRAARAVRASARLRRRRVAPLPRRGRRGRRGARAAAAADPREGQGRRHARDPDLGPRRIARRARRGDARPLRLRGHVARPARRLRPRALRPAHGRRARAPRGPPPDRARPSGSQAARRAARAEPGAASHRARRGRHAPRLLRGAVRVDQPPLGAALRAARGLAQVRGAAAARAVRRRRRPRRGAQPGGHAAVRRRAARLSADRAALARRGRQAGPREPRDARAAARARLRRRGATPAAEAALRRGRRSQAPRRPRRQDERDARPLPPGADRPGDRTRARGDPAPPGHGPGAPAARLSRARAGRHARGDRGGAARRGAASRRRRGVGAARRLPDGSGPRPGCGRVPGPVAGARDRRPRRAQRAGDRARELRPLE